MKKNFVEDRNFDRNMDRAIINLITDVQMQCHAEVIKGMKKEKPSGRVYPIPGGRARGGNRHPLTIVRNSGKKVSAYRASRRGEFPARRTSRLWQSIGWVEPAMIKRSSTLFHGGIGVNVNRLTSGTKSKFNYARHLEENMGRKLFMWIPRDRAATQRILGRNLKFRR